MFPYPPSSTGNPGIIPSDDAGEALSVSSKDIHPSKHAKISGIHCTLWPQCTNFTDRWTDGQRDGHITDVYITSRAKNQLSQIKSNLFKNSFFTFSVDAISHTFRLVCVICIVLCAFFYSFLVAPLAHCDSRLK